MTIAALFLLIGGVSIALGRTLEWVSRHLPKPPSDVSGRRP